LAGSDVDQFPPAFVGNEINFTVSCTAYVELGNTRWNHADAMNTEGSKNKVNFEQILKIQKPKNQTSFASE
jgi:hypothetical protein